MPHAFILVVRSVHFDYGLSKALYVAQQDSFIVCILTYFNYECIHINETFHIDRVKNRYYSKVVRSI